MGQNQERMEEIQIAVIVRRESKVNSDTFMRVNLNTIKRVILKKNAKKFKKVQMF